jgi:hypothetical protein
MANNPDGIPDGNTLLYLGTRIVILKELGLLTDEDVTGFKLAVYRSWHKIGVLNRGWGREDAQAHDDYIGVMAAAKICAPEIAKSIVEYGKRNYWYYNNKGVSRFFSALFIRMPGIVQHFKSAAGEPLNSFDEFMIDIDLMFTTFRPANEVSGRILDWLKIKTMDLNQHPELIGVVEAWKADIKRKYPKLMGDVFAKYFGEKHPFAIYMDGRL